MERLHPAAKQRAASHKKYFLMITILVFLKLSSFILGEYFWTVDNLWNEYFKQ